MNIVEQIHSEFYSASDDLRQKAASVTENPRKAETLKRLGFTETKEITQQANDKWAKYYAELSNYYAFRYPLNKFITKEQVSEVCSKYGLVCGPVSLYTGTVPDEKLKMIADFKLRKEDVIVEHQSRMFSFRPWEEKSGSNFIVWLVLKMFGYCPDFVLFFTLYQHRLQSPELMICAPKKEMKITDPFMRFGDDGFIEHIPDPVVLQPVKGGYLILAAWGDEASDAGVVNEKMN